VKHSKCSDEIFDFKSELLNGGAGLTNRYLMTKLSYTHPPENTPPRLTLAHSNKASTYIIVNVKVSKQTCSAQSQRRIVITLKKIFTKMDSHLSMRLLKCLKT